MNFSFDVLSQIASGSNMFSQAENKLAQFVMKDPQRVLTLSITEFAKSCDVSLATVLRFCKRLSLNGYQEFRLELMRSVSNSKESQDQCTSDFVPQDTLPDIMDKVGTMLHYSLNKSMSALDAAATKNVCDLIDQAESVHFVGSGNMLLTALCAKVQFMQVSTKFHCDFDPAIQALSACLMNEKSLIILFSYTGSTRDIVEVAKMAKERGATVVAITRYTRSPLVECADAVLICGVSEGPFQSGSLAVSVGMMYIINVLYTEYCRRHPVQSEENKEHTSWAVVGKIKPLKNTPIP